VENHTSAVSFGNNTLNGKKTPMNRDMSVETYAAGTVVHTDFVGDVSFQVRELCR
jgi:hypothetical protein